MKILVTGGCGYVGSILIPKLLNKNHKVINIDNQWFGNYLKKHKNLLNLKIDIRNIPEKIFNKVDTIIHLASIANDPMAEIDKNLSWETSCLGTLRLMNLAKKFKIKRLIYASSGSVYGIKKERNVTEKLSLKPISLYNKVKMITEKVIQSYNKEIENFIIRPATVCGYSPRMRFDVTVNALSYSALKNGKIIVNGGSQIRPNIHVEDLTDLYIYLLKINKKYAGIYNAGFENLTVLNIAKTVKKYIKSDIKIIKQNFDPRSYRLDSRKLLKIGFKPSYKIEDAILNLKEKYLEKKIKDNPKFYSIKWLKKLHKSNHL